MAGPEGRKITFACEMCRKRKARCSGVVPCTFCQKHAFNCTLDLNRQRRGPRGPRKKKNRATTEIHPSVIEEETPSNLSRPVAVLLGDPVLEPEQRSPDIAASTEAALSESPLYEIGNWAGPVWALPFQDDSWAAALSLQAGSPSTNHLPFGLSLDLQCHLLHLFCTHVNNQQCLLLPLGHLYRLLTEQKCPDYLLLAVFASSICYSSKTSPNDSNPPWSEEQLIAQARESANVLCEGMPTLSQVQMLLIFIQCAGRKGGGVQAWCDIAVAEALLQIIEINACTEPENLETLEIASRCLHITKSIHCLGYPGITPRPTQAWETAVPSSSIEGNPLGEANHIAALFGMLCKVQSFWSECDFPQSHKPHWKSNSEFMDLKEEVDQISIRQPNEYRFSSSGFLQRINQGDGPGQYLLGSLAWHCCIILLNRIFLPIQIGSSDAKILLNYPQAPKQFLKEKNVSLAASASAIAIICSDVVAVDEFVMPPFMGYCCFHSSIILIDQLRRLGPSAEYLEHLKVNYSVLNALRQVFKPAQEWLDTLLQIHEPDREHTRVADPDKSFSSFFARYNHIAEPHFIPLTSSSNESIAQLESVLDEPICELTPPAEVAKPNSDDWISQYRQDLLEQLSDTSEVEAVDLNNHEIEIETSSSNSQVLLSQAPFQLDMDMHLDYAGVAGGDPGLFPFMSTDFIMSLNDTQFLNNQLYDMNSA